MARRTPANPKAAPLCINLNEHEAVLGPAGGAYASFAILQPVITVELLDGEYHISARFNLQTNVHHEEVDDDSDSTHTWFLDSVRLRYESIIEDEQCVGQPGAEAEGAYTVTSTTGSSVSTDFGATVGGLTNSGGNIKLGMVRNTNTAVEQKLKSWTTASDRLTDAMLQPEVTLRPKGTWAKLNPFIDRQRNTALDPPAGWEWFWQGTQNTTNIISMDQTRSVTRHVIITRILSCQQYDEANQPGEKSDYLTFDLNIKIMVRELGHGFRARMTRKMRYDAKTNPGKLLNPPYMAYFSLAGCRRDRDPLQLPTEETEAIGSLLIMAKEKYANNLDCLHRVKLNRIEPKRQRRLSHEHQSRPNSSALLRAEKVGSGGDDSRSDVTTSTDSDQFVVVNWDNKQNRYT